ncbi:MAG: glycosidase, partial [Rhodopirellula bahusiensis]
MVTRLPVKFTADDRWVVTRPFMPGGEIRVRRVLDRIAKMSSSEASAVLRQVETQFASRRCWFEAELRSHFEQAVAMVPQRRDLDPTKQLLAGAYFTMEYAFASAALFNPSIVSHPDQTGIAEDSLRFVMSLRATGEGHISSIVFRTGVIGPRH